jgi:hypothetical protein
VAYVQRSEAIVDGVRLVSLHGHTPGHTGHEFFVKGTENSVLGYARGILDDIDHLALSVGKELPTPNATGVRCRARERQNKCGT